MKESLDNMSKTLKTVILACTAIVVVAVFIISGIIFVRSDPLTLKTPILDKSLLSHVIKDYQRLPYYIGSMIVFVDVATVVC